MKKREVISSKLLAADAFNTCGLERHKALFTETVESKEITIDSRGREAARQYVFEKNDGGFLVRIIDKDGTFFTHEDPNKYNAIQRAVYKAQFSRFDSKSKKIAEGTPKVFLLGTQ